MRVVNETTHFTVIYSISERLFIKFSYGMQINEKYVFVLYHTFGI